jgi:DNA excision repair protein ERCC-2
LAGKYEVKVGVRELLELFFTPKDLNTTFISPTRGQEGTVGHQLIAKQRPPDYQREVYIEHVYENEEYRLVVQGRIDGVLKHNSGVIVEEIKTTYFPVANLSYGQFPVHEAQLKLYLYFYMSQYPELNVKGQLTYLNLEDLSEKSFSITLSLDEGEQFFNGLAVKYLEVIADGNCWRHLRNQSIQALDFPFPDVRAGQTELMEVVTQAIEQERDLLVEAATGIGKTIGVLFPALKRLALSNRYNQIFFLTAKNAGKEVLKKTLLTLKEQGLRLRTVFIEAKERVCFVPGSKCQPQDCLYAADYYLKARSVLSILLKKEYITPEDVLEAARAYTVCPFELSLDLSLKVDLIVCDYNYLFDPGVYLRRFFAQNRKDFLFLVDEAHNLVTRGREMYSATFSEHRINEFCRMIQGYNRNIFNAVEAIIAFFNSWRREMESEHSQVSGFLLEHLPEFFIPSLEKLIALLEFQIKEDLFSELREIILTFYFEVTAFTRLAQLAGGKYSKEYALYVKHEFEAGEELLLRIYCLNPGLLLRERLEHGRSAIFFSATLTPFSYFLELLGARPDTLTVQLTSPFPQETRLYLHQAGIDTRYRARNQTAAELAKCILKMVTAHKGNYLVFFPSYSYLQTVLPLVKVLLMGKANLFVQIPAMNESQRREFLRKITDTGAENSNVGLAVLGGSFGEGIDLPGEQLEGVMIVGPGLPAVSEEQELIKVYFDERGGHGFLYAYLIPGLIKVIQAAGRVFRTPDDRGVVILVDDRFLGEHYRELLPPDWFKPGREFSVADLDEVLQEFWKE